MILELYTPNDVYIGTIDIDGIPILMNYSIKDINNPSLNKQTNSYPISINRTKETDIIFHNLYNINTQIVQTGFNILLKNRYILKKGGITVIAGDIMLKGYNKEKYEVVLFSGIGSFFNAVEKNLIDIDDAAYTHNPIKKFNEARNVNNPNIYTDYNLLNSDDILECYMNYPIVYQDIYEEFDNKKMVSVTTWGSGHKLVNASLLADNDSQGHAIDNTGRFSGDEFSENQIGEYRIQYQVPFLQLKRLYNCCLNEYRNAGYNINLDGSFFNANNPYWNNTYISTKQVNKLVRGESNKQSDYSFKAHQLKNIVIFAA